MKPEDHFYKTGSEAVGSLLDVFPFTEEGTEGQLMCHYDKKPDTVKASDFLKPGEMLVLIVSNDCISK